LDQGACGSCVSFGSCTATESAARIGTNNPSLAIQLSEAQLFYCVARSQGRTCAGASGGWWVPPALTALQYPGIADAACYPYTAGDQNCTNLCANWQQRVTNITGWHSLTAVADMKAWLATRGPLVTCLSVYDDFMYYGTGVYQHSTGNLDGGHCVCIIGYDDTKGAWIGKNSWGTGWGMAGVFLYRLRPVRHRRADVRHGRRRQRGACARSQHQRQAGGAPARHPGQGPVAPDAEFLHRKRLGVLGQPGRRHHHRSLRHR